MYFFSSSVLLDLRDALAAAEKQGPDWDLRGCTGVSGDVPPRPRGAIIGPIHSPRKQPMRDLIRERCTIHGTSESWHRRRSRALPAFLRREETPRDLGGRSGVVVHRTNGPHLPTESMQPWPERPVHLLLRRPRSFFLPVPWETPRN
jgi:hypothetical protein